MLAKDIMSSPVATIPEDKTVYDAASLMLEQVVSCLVVVDDSGQIAGILTHTDFGLHHKFMPLGGDLYQLLGSWADSTTMEETAQRVRGRAIKEVMNREVVVISESAPISDVIEVMLQRHVNRLPVVRDGKLVGVITRHDLLKLIISNPDQS